MRIDRGNKHIQEKQGAKTTQSSFGDINQDSMGRTSFSRDSATGRTTFFHDQDEDLTDFKNLENEVKSQETDMMMKFNSTGNHENLGNLSLNNEETIEEEFEHGGDTNRYLKPNVRIEGDDVNLEFNDLHVQGGELGEEEDDQFNETQRLEKFAKQQSESEVGDMDDLIDEMM